MKTKTVSTEQKIKNLEQRLKELRVMQKRETRPAEVKRLIEEVSRVQNRINKLKEEITDKA